MQSTSTGSGDAQKLDLTDPVLLKLDTLLRIEVGSWQCTVQRAIGIIKTCLGLTSDIQLEADRSRRSHPIFAAEVYTSEVSGEASQNGSAINVLSTLETSRKMVAESEGMDRKTTRYPFWMEQFTTTRRPMFFARCCSNPTLPCRPSSLLEV